MKYLLLGVIVGLLIFQSLLYQQIWNLQEQLQSEREQHLSEVTNYKNSLNLLGQKYEACYNQSKELNKTINRLIASLTEVEQRKQELERILYKSNKISLQPSYKIVKQFMMKDDTDKLTWSDDFDCSEFSRRFIANFRKQGYFACVTELDFNDSAHDIVAINTSDKGIIFVEPQSDEIITQEELQVGVNYCDLVNWYCDWRITKISNCFYYSTSYKEYNYYE